MLQDGRIFGGGGVSMVVMTSGRVRGWLEVDAVVWRGRFCVWMDNY